MKELESMRRKTAANQIAAAMRTKGISKKQLADMMGKSPSEVTRWLSGDHNFTLDILARLSNVLGMEITGVDSRALYVQEIGNLVLEDPSSSAINLCIPSFAMPGLIKRASAHNLPVKDYIVELAVNDARKADVCFRDFAGVWSDEAFPSEDELVRGLRAARTRNREIEL
jgi:Helix-turn-helix.